MENNRPLARRDADAGRRPKTDSIAVRVDFRPAPTVPPSVGRPGDQSRTTERRLHGTSAQQWKGGRALLRRDKETVRAVKACQLERGLGLAMGVGSVVNR